jgi:adenine deaminase
MVRHGFTPYEALLTATRNPARWLNQDRHLGLIAPGAHADLALLKGNPLTDINAAANIHQVMLRGTLHTLDSLLTPFTTPTPTLTPALVTSAPTTRHDHTTWWHTPEWSQLICCGTP